MILWGFLILAFIAGFASCYGVIYLVAKVYRATKSVGLD